MHASLISFVFSTWIINEFLNNIYKSWDKGFVHGVVQFNIKQSSSILWLYSLPGFKTIMHILIDYMHQSSAKSRKAWSQ